MIKRVTGHRHAGCWIRLKRKLLIFLTTAIRREITNLMIKRRTKKMNGEETNELSLSDISQQSNYHALHYHKSIRSICYRNSTHNNHMIKRVTVLDSVETQTSHIDSDGIVFQKSWKESRKP
ncbi:unnamed protein product [Microthlaspi erraticum]|uniref:Uncharacterized protein n=1 Tax=Microthlaspi erraticum TaxID=1685480 RepID=A0A6D2HTL2_9BRAS|nr:unnamed protein product [Microthlaspi erraticum]